jgi:hypothetical protein
MTDSLTHEMDEMEFDQLEEIDEVTALKDRVEDEEDYRQEMPPHKVLREVLRNYLSYRDHLAYVDAGQDVIEHSYLVTEKDSDGNLYRRKVTLTVSFSDLQNCLLPQSKGGILSERKREALLYNVVFDWRQQDVAEKMGITPVSVGQYADLALRQLAKKYFTAEDLAHSKFDYGKTK